MESLHIFLESNYKIGSLVKKVQESIQFVYLCVIRNFKLIKCNVAVNSISISHQDTIAETSFTHFVSLRR